MVKFHVKTDLGKIEPKIHDVLRAATYVTSDQALKDSNIFIPAHRWGLRDSSLIASRLEEGELIWSTPYARRLYHNPQYNFSTDKNPSAGGLWFERAKSAYSRDWHTVARREYQRRLRG